MKKYYILGVLALGLMTSCQEEEIFVRGQLANSNVVVTASLDESSTTRTQLALDDNGYKVLWAEGDALSIFSSNTAHAKFELSKGAGEANADFKFKGGDLNFGTEAGSDDFGYVGVYPYLEGTTVTKGEGLYTINTVIPTEQTYAVNSFGQDASPMVAVDPSLKLSFKNVGSMLVLPLKGEGTITSATLKSKAHNIAGAAVVTVTEEDGWIPSVTVAEGASEGASEVVLSCGEGVELSAEAATKFFFVLAPGTYEANDLVITFNNADGKYFETVITAKNTFNRSQSLTFGERTFAETGVVGGVSTEDALRAAIAEGGEVILGSNVVLDTYLSISKDVTIDLNGKTLEREGTEGNKTVLYATAGDVTIQGDGIVKGASAVWAAGSSKFVVKGGHYIMTCTDPDNQTGYPLIYSKGGAITIEGGIFESNVGDNVSFAGAQYNLLNVYGNSGGSIVVKGGKFKNFNPGNNYSEGEKTSFVAEGYKVVIKGTTTVATEAYDVNAGEVWYEVVAK